MEKNFVAVYIHRHKTMKDLIRIDYKSKPPEGYQNETMFYAINPFSTYTKINGTYVIYFLNNEKAPYQTINISYNDNFYHFASFSNIMLVSYSFHVENSRFLYFENSRFDTHKNIIVHDTNPNYDVPMNQKKYLFRLTIFDKPYLYWKCLPNCICVPTDNKNEYDTKMGCMYNCYNHNYNQNTYVNDSSKVLHEIFKKSF